MGREKDCPSTVAICNDHSGYGRAKPRPETWNPTWVSYESPGVQTLMPSATFPGKYAGSWISSGAARTQTSTDRG